MAPSRTVYIKFFTGVDVNTITTLTQLIQDQLKKRVDRFVLLISRPGGNVFAGLSGYNFLKGIPAEVVTHNFGSVDSIAAVLFCAGSQRLCVPHARFLLHGIGFDVNEKTRFDEKILDERLKGLKVDRENMSRVIADNTGKSLAEVERDILEGTVLNSRQALAYGLVHKIRAELFCKEANRVGLEARIILSDSEAVDSSGHPTDFVFDTENLIGRLFEFSPVPTGLFIPGDMFISSLYHELTVRKAQFGSDFDIVTLNQHRPSLKGLDPCPAIIDCKPDYIGSRACQQLLWRRLHPDDPQQTILVKPTLLSM